MEKSIETIWKKGFFEETPVNIPKINDLYNRKSIHLIDKLLRTLQVDLWSLIPVTVLVTGWLFYQSESLLIGLATALCCLLLFFMGRTKVEQLKKLDKGTNCYQYLNDVKSWIKETVSFYTKVMAIGGPLFVLFVHFVLMNISTDHAFSQVYDKLGTDGTFWFIGLSLLVTAILGVSVYRLSVKAVYGTTLHKIDTLIEDMSELRKQN